MPMYEYECTKCGHRFEVIQKFSDAPRTKCPECKGLLRKLVSASAIQFKGSGWYVTDYGKKGDAGEKSGDKTDKPVKEEKAKDDKGTQKPEAKPKTEAKADKK